MTAYYNEVDPYAAQWLRNLIGRGLIAAGDVDERSIVDVRPDDLRGYTQCHFFAGIGGWSYALRLAGWSDDRPVWTGSCPCQPFSAAGKGKAADDERHLWPAWFSLLRECKPAIVFGEQVDDAIGWGWLDLVCSQMEAEGYAIGATVLPASGVEAPHIRDRLWFVANAEGRDQRRLGGEPRSETIASSGQARQENGNAAGGSGAMGGLVHSPSEQAGLPGCSREPRAAVGELGIPGSKGLAERERHGRVQRQALGSAGQAVVGAGNPWSDLEWLPCTDGKARPTKPGLLPLAHGIPARVGKLRAAGNAIVPQVAAVFIGAVMEARA